jgi:hypothetical protein
MTLSASAINDGGRVVCILLTTRQKSITKFQKFGDKGTCHRPLAQWEGEAETVQVRAWQITRSRFDSDHPLQSFKKCALMLFLPCEVYSNRGFYSLDSVSVRFGNRGEAIRTDKSGISKAKPSFLLSACRGYYLNRYARSSSISA